MLRSRRGGFVAKISGFGGALVAMALSRIGDIRENAFSGARRSIKRFPSVGMNRIFHRPLEISSPYGVLNSLSASTRQGLIIACSLTTAILLLYLYIFAPKGLIARNRVKEMVIEKKAEVDAARELNSSLRRDISALNSDTETIEAMARNELSMSMPNETIYRTRRDTIPAYVLNIVPHKSVLR